jgi:two-component sensor histidine kinase
MTEEWLSARPPRPCDHARENAALLALADEMAERPDNVLHLLCELVLETCDADSAGVSLLDGDNDEFVWPAVAGAWAPFVNGAMPRSASPCGKVIDHDRVLIFRDVLAQFPATAQAQPEIDEIMLAPFHRDGAPIGTVWAISHKPGRQFDAEDRRVLGDLARFAAAAYHMTGAHEAARSAQKQLSIANRELGHRLKNMLSMVMAVVGQTLKRQADQSQVKVLQRRLEALGAAHNVLIDQDSSPASIQAIAQSVVGVLGQSERVSLDGPPLTLGPRSALGCSLVLHELCTNALKYGALSNDKGRVALSWAVNGEGAEAAVVLKWEESGGPPVAEPQHSGLGTRLISMGLLGSGETRIDYDPAGLRVELTASLHEATTL